MSRKVLLVSNYNAVRRPWNGVLYEFFNVVAGIEDAAIVAPDLAGVEVGPAMTWGGLLQAAGVELGERIGRAAGRSLAPRMRKARLDADYDLCVFACQFSKNIPEIDRVRDWRARSRFAVAFILETWTGEVERRRADLRLLDRFDHVFVLNAESIPALRRFTTAPVSFLASAVDCLLATPGPQAPDRVIDVFSMGRRQPQVHEALLQVAEERNLFYLFDVWNYLTARDWAEARVANAGIIKRSRYFIAWDPVTVSPTKGNLIQEEKAISTRYFEGAAGGSILVGSRPRCPEFNRLFDWPDAVVEVPAGRPVGEVLAELDGDPDRVRAARSANVVNSLRCHDWAFRWSEILAVAGLEQTPAQHARLDQMERLAGQAELERRGTARPASA